MDYVILRGFARSVIKPNADFINNLTAFGSDWRRLAIPDRAAAVSVRSPGDGAERTTEPSRAWLDRTRKRHCPDDSITR